MPSRRDFHKFSLAAAVAVALPARALAQNAPPASLAAPAGGRPQDMLTLRPELYGTQGMVAAGTQYTVDAGTRILAAGGNAFDAGVAAVLAAAVNEISHFGMGGEAPAIVFQAGTGKVTVISGQGPAPRAANAALFRAAGGIPGNGPNGGTVPAVIDAMALALQRFGTMSLGQVLEPAIRLADGFPMYGALRNALLTQRQRTFRGEWSRRPY
jgi:gamma-glutamyltranspeptidase/glutathione hydrolase